MPSWGFNSTKGNDSALKFNVFIFLAISLCSLAKEIKLTLSLNTCRMGLFNLFGAKFQIDQTDIAHDAMPKIEFLSLNVPQESLTLIRLQKKNLINLVLRGPCGPR